MANGDNVLLEIKNLDVSFYTPMGEVRAVNNVSFKLMNGEVLGIVGESGSGKSVSAYSLMGLIPEPGRIKNGTIMFDGKAIHLMDEKALRQIRGNEISIIFQDPMTSLNPVFSVGNQIMEVILLHTDFDKETARTRAIELLEMVGVNEPARRLKQYPHEFSGGMRQRVMIAMALACCETKLLIADEPTTALDVTIQAQILELMAELKQKMGMSIILITHDLGVVADMCERILVMYAGRVVESGTTEEIFYAPNHPYTLGLLASIPKLNIVQHEKLVPIEGTPVDSLNLPAGCPFAPRCRSCMKICLREMPGYTQLSDTHTSACWLSEKRLLDTAASAAGEVVL
jgi:oligopeptide transport system ATP-binding protein